MAKWSKIKEKIIWPHKAASKTLATPIFGIKMIHEVTKKVPSRPPIKNIFGALVIELTDGNPFLMHNVAIHSARKPLPNENKAE